MGAPQDNEHQLRRSADRQTTPVLSDAIKDLNRSGHLVCEHGTLRIDGETVWIRVRGARLIAVLADKTEIPWPRFRTILTRRTA